MILEFGAIVKIVYHVDKICSCAVIDTCTQLGVSVDEMLYVGVFFDGLEIEKTCKNL